jgi:group I intron endonuclease
VRIIYNINKDTMIIYKIENKINHKKYIGYTTHTLEWRWKRHLNVAYNPNSKDYNEVFKRAIRKYGKENFELSIIEKCDTIEELKEKEVYWIAKYNTYIGNKQSWGYNSTKGGDGAHGYGVTPVSQFDILSGKLIKKYNNQTDAIIENCKGINESCRKSDKPLTVNGTCFFYTKDVENLTEEQIVEKVHNRYPYLLYQLDLEGNFVKLWRNTSEPNKELGYNSGNIIMVCNNQRREANGYQWCYQKNLKDRINKPIKEINYNKNIVIQYDKNGNYIKEWNSIREAANTLNLQESKISNCCKGIRNHTGEFQWRYKEDYVDKLTPLKLYKKVKCIETGEIFDTTNKAAKAYGVAHATMKNACEGKNTKLKYHFKYFL